MMKDPKYSKLIDSILTVVVLSGSLLLVTSLALTGLVGDNGLMA